MRLRSYAITAVGLGLSVSLSVNVVLHCFADLKPRVPVK
jgi:hypothetical protein